MKCIPLIQHILQWWINGRVPVENVCYFRSHDLQSWPGRMRQIQPRFNIPQMTMLFWIWQFDKVSNLYTCMLVSGQLSWNPDNITWWYMVHFKSYILEFLCYQQHFSSLWCFDTIGAVSHQSWCQNDCRVHSCSLDPPTFQCFICVREPDALSWACECTFVLALNHQSLDKQQL